MSSRTIPSNSEQTDSKWGHPSTILVVAWAATILISTLPNIILQEVIKSSTIWLLTAKLALLGLLILSTFAWRTLRPLRGYFIVFVVFYLSDWLFGFIVDTALWKSWFNSSAFTVNMFGVQVVKLLPALVMIAALFIIKRRRSEFYLVKGQTDALADPVHWLGISRPVSWARLAPIAALCITLGTLAFMVMAGAPSLQAVSRVLPMLPMILLLAALNAFSEQVTYRASLLATLNGVVGKPQALILSAYYFGIAHFYGVPYGVVGVIMAGFLGWFLSKSMMETKGFFWPWFIHFCQDAAIFTFMGMGSIVPGGGKPPG